MATRDIISKGRQKNSVVILSAGMETSLTRDQLSTDATYLIEYYSPVRRLLDLGVPLICASGNFADQPGRQDIDSLPQLYQGDDLPIINVGAAGYDGQRWYKSQGGPVLTLYAPGVDVLTMSKVEQQHVRNSGTSLGK